MKSLLILTALLFTLRSEAGPFQGVLAGNVVQQDGQSAEFTVKLNIKKKDGSLGGCSGVIVGEDLILTAGHCLTGDGHTVTVQFGRGGRAGFVKEIESKRYITRNLRPPETGPSRWNDAGEMKFNEESQKSFFELVASLRTWHDVAQEASSRSRLFEDISLIKISRIPRGFRPVRPYEGSLSFGQDLIVAGFGTNSRIRAENDDVLRWGRQTLIGHFTLPGQQTKGWEYYSPEGKNACAGDSGAPVLARSNSGELQLVGLHIFSINSCANSGFSFRLEFFRNWIENAARTLNGHLAI